MAARNRKKSSSAKKRVSSKGKSKKLKKASGKAIAAKRAKSKRKSIKTIRPRQGFAGKREVPGRVVYEPAGLGAGSGGQSGDLQGLSDRRRAGSESVDELLEEGNAFEATVLQGVEDVEDEQEVHTHEVPEDDVPGEYRDKD